MMYINDEDDEINFEGVLQDLKTNSELFLQNIDGFKKAYKKEVNSEIIETLAIAIMDKLGDLLVPNRPGTYEAAEAAINNIINKTLHNAVEIVKKVAIDFENHVNNDASET